MRKLFGGIMVGVLALALVFCGLASWRGPLGATEAQAADLAATISAPAAVGAATNGTFDVMIDLPAGSSEANINPASLRLALPDYPGAGEVPSLAGVLSGGRYKATFRAAILGYVAPPANDLRIRVSGALIDLTSFEGETLVDTFKPLTITQVFVSDVMPDIGAICPGEECPPGATCYECPDHACPLETGGYRYCAETVFGRGEPIWITCFYEVDPRTPGIAPGFSRLKVSLIVEAFGKKFGVRPTNWMPANGGPGRLGFSILVPADAPLGPETLDLTLRLKKGTKLWDTAQPAVMPVVTVVPSTDWTP